MTPEEAKGKRCPMALIYKCKADGCMCWRWRTVRIENKTDSHGISYSNKFQSSTDGYCGLAGKE